ncbi:hypothetical protein SK128_027051 [Halocaridina rubra]|uniref:Uncharacterized protein n=1 Tax=Halocaridina rubra TaxID=373956 RepID=A0AAN8WQG9_HALRR
MFFSMEEQSNLSARLKEENKRYIIENGKLKARSRPGNAFNPDPYNCYILNHHPHYDNHDGISDLEDKIMDLRLQNSELSLNLQREQRRRREAEEKLDRDRGYIKRLEDSVQTLRGTRVIMDPSTYQQVAEAYIAARRTPARRPHTHCGIPGSDLVCDSAHQQASHLQLHQSSSCPASPPHNSCSSPSTTRRMYPPLNSMEYQMYPGDKPIARKSKKENSQTPQDFGIDLGIGGSPMNPRDYQQLLKNLEDIDRPSRGALS